MVGFAPAAHHRLLLRELEAVSRGECNRLAIFMPPGSAKSTYSSVLFPPWLLSRKPDSCVIAASHTQELADTFGRRVRNLVQEYGPVLGYSLSKDSQAAGRWNTTNGCEYFAAGVGGSITGRRADLALIDDPVKSAEDADSEVNRERQWDWYRFDLLTRLKPGAAVILIQTRWHEEDLAGKILAAEGNKWRVIRLPMVAELDDALGRAPGEPLWPEYFTADMRTQAKLSPRVWTALYQQRPTAEEGAFFKTDFLLTYQPHELPARLRVYVASDHAVSLAQERDATCLLPAGVDESGDLWVLPDVWWERKDTKDVVEAMLGIMRRHKPLFWWAERGHISKAIGPFLRDRMQEEQTYCAVDEVVPVKDKQTRAQSIQARCSMRKVHFPAFAPWWPDALDELLKFPNGAHDDFVDALAHLGMGLDRLVPAEAPQKWKETMPKPMTIDWVKQSSKYRQHEVAMKNKGGF